MHLILTDTNLGSQQLISMLKIKTSFLGNKLPYRSVKSDLKFFAEYIVAHMIDHSQQILLSLWDTSVEQPFGLSKAA